MSVVVSRRRARRLLLGAFLLSAFIHFTGAGLYGVFSARFPRFQTGMPHPEPTEGFVMMTQALTFDKRPRPAPRAKPASRPRAHPRPAAHALPQERRPRVVARLLPQPKVRIRPRPVVPALANASPARVGKSERSAATTLSEERMARLNQVFARTIAASRAAVDPLRTSTHVATTMKSYHLPFQGRISDLRVGQGILTPIKSWSADGYTYYYVTYEIVWPDGTYESGSVPWPIRYRPAEDPFADGVPGRRIPLPGPSQGWELPAGTHLGKALREYFPGYTDPEG